MAFLLTAAAALSMATAASAFNLSSNDLLTVYWGQNSAGAADPSDTSAYQQPLGDYCNDDTYDVLLLAFLTVFDGTGGAPEINFANSCSDTTNGTFPGTDLANCTAMSSDIEKCQAAGKIVSLSMGGASGAYGFTDNATATAFADQIWDLFLGGENDTRPFGDAVLDGVDLDIEGGSTEGYSAFVQQLQTHFQDANKTYYVSAAPQCPFPDAYVGTTLNSEPFDFVNIQFYNNYCGLNDYNSSSWDYASWETWAQTVSPNPDVKLFIGAPASTTAASTGYVDAATLGGIAQATQANSTSFGGIMLWDASQAAANNNYGAAVKQYLTGSANSPIRPKTLENLHDVVKKGTDKLVKKVRKGLRIRD